MELGEEGGGGGVKMFWINKYPETSMIKLCIFLLTHPGLWSGGGGGGRGHWYIVILNDLDLYNFISFQWNMLEWGRTENLSYRCSRCVTFHHSDVLDVLRFTRPCYWNITQLCEHEPIRWMWLRYVNIFKRKLFTWPIYQVYCHLCHRISLTLTQITLFSLVSSMFNLVTY